MSGFIKRNRAVNTANPAGGVNPALEPNVGQYGWTNYEAGFVNQIIGYVDLCREYAQQAKDSAEYVALRFGELEEFMRYIENVYETVKPLYDNIEVLYADIVLRHGQIVLIHEDVIIKHGEIQAWTVENRNIVVRTEASALQAATSAAEAFASKSDAELAAQEAKDLVEELRKGQVYRGVWNMEATMAYPPAPNTNSIWDVVLNGSTITGVTVNGLLWYWGDRLVYILDTNSWAQIESGSNVISVNGKSGSVTLDYTDVGAAPTGFGLGEAFPGSQSGGTINNLKYNGFRTYNRDAGDTGAPAPYGTLLDIGHLGNGTTYTGWCSQIFVDNDGNVYNRSNLTPGTYDGSSWHRLYSTGTPPTLTELGAYPKVGGLLDGSMWSPNNFKGFVSLENQASIRFRDTTHTWFHLYSAGNIFHLGSGNGGEFSLLNVDNSGNTTIGGRMSIPNSDDPIHTKGGHVATLANSMHIRGNNYSFVGSPLDAHLSCNAYYDGSLWKKWDNNRSAVSLMVNEHGPQVIYSAPGNPNADAERLKIFHEGHLPTADQINAVPSKRVLQNGAESSWLHIATLTANIGSYGNGISLILSDGLSFGDPAQGVFLVTLGTRGYDGVSPITPSLCQIKRLSGQSIEGVSFVLFRVGGFVQLWAYRVAYSSPMTASVINSWDAQLIMVVQANKPGFDSEVDVPIVEMYDTAFKPTAADIGSLPTAGGDMSGGIYFPASSSEIKVDSSASLDIRGGTHLMLSAMNGVSYVGSNFYWNGAWQKPNINKESVILEVGAKEMSFLYSAPGETNPIATRYKFYTEAFKPNITDLGGAKSTFIGGGANLDEYYGITQVGMYEVNGTNTNGWPWNNVSGGSMFVMHSSGNYAVQQAYHAFTGECKVRTRHGGTNSWSNWFTVYNEAFPMKAAEIGAMPIGGGTFTGKVDLVSNDLYAIHVPGGSGITYSNAASHQYHFTNAVSATGKWTIYASGGEISVPRTVFETDRDGTLETSGAHFARSGQIAKSKNDNNWIAIEAPEDTNPYISAKAPGDASVFKVIDFGKNEVVFTKRPASGEYRIATNAGLKFAVDAHLPGASWGMGMDGATGVLAIHRYQDSVWQGTPLQFGMDNSVQAGANLIAGAAVLSAGGYIKTERPSNPTFEWHATGIHAWISYVPYDGGLIMGASNGAGGLVSRAVHLGPGASWFDGRINVTTRQARGWTDMGVAAFHNAETPAVAGNLFGLVTGRYHLPGVANVEMGLGSMHLGDVNSTANVLFCTDGGAYLRAWYFRNNGQLEVAGGNWYITPAGHEWATGYGNQFLHEWASQSFAPLSDEKLKKNIKSTTKSALDDVAKIDFVSYDWKEKGGHVDIGVTAQQLETIDPCYAKDIETYEEDGVTVNSSVKALDTANLLALALKSIQELQAKVTELEEKLNELV